MQVPRSAIGKTGMCPTCGKTVAIGVDNTAPQANPQHGRVFSANTLWWGGQGPPTEDAKRKFGEAVDLFTNHRFAEALAIFDALAKQYPGDQHIENGRIQCLNALKRPHLALEHGGENLESAKLDEDTVKKVVLDKLLRGSTESVRLQAAELACKILGIGPNGQPPEPDKGESDEVSAGAETEDESGDKAADSEDESGPPGLYDIE
jgi:hypothetical protein